MTTDELLALPEDGMERWLIDGELRERPMTRRNRRHSRSTIRIGYFLEKWRESQPAPRGEVLGGEAGFRLRPAPETTVGIDVAYISPELAARTPENARLVDGPPILAVEVLSPSNAQEDILEKVQRYLDCGVALVWVVEPVFRTVTLYRPGAEPQMFTVQQELTGEPHLPGLRIRVADIFS